MDFLDYLGEHYSLQHVSLGTQVKLSGDACPFCGEDRDDLRIYVNATTGKGICHHCGQGFGPVGFVMAYEGCNKAQALKILNGEHEGYVAHGDSEPPPVVELGTVWPECQPIEEVPAAQAYLEGRDIGLGVIKHFGLYYAPSHTQIGEQVYYTAGRVVIPIYDQSGKPVSWQARDISGRAKTRYIFPPGFKGAENLYNSHSIKPHAPYLILCEGVFDAMGWWRSGFTNVVATFGKKISTGQLDILRKLSPDVLFIAWDFDAHVNKYEFCEHYGYAFKRVLIVDLGEKDADELTKAELLEAIKKGLPYSWEAKITGLLR